MNEQPMKAQIEVITYEQERLNYFADLMEKAQNRYKRLFKKYKDAPMLSEESQLLSDAGREAQFHGDVVEMLEKCNREWISVEDQEEPTENGTYLCYGYWVYSGRKQIETVRYFGEWDIVNNFVPTHWMPLPEPPKMEGGA